VRNFDFIRGALCERKFVIGNLLANVDIARSPHVPYPVTGEGGGERGERENHMDIEKPSFRVGTIKGRFALCGTTRHGITKYFCMVLTCSNLQ
jgi:hypothetical protein